jgi:hypothetical protein
MDQIQTGMAFLRKVVLRKPIPLSFGGVEQINLVIELNNRLLQDGVVNYTSNKKI